MLASPYTAHKWERYQLRMRAISRSKHTKLKNTKIYSKGVLVNHMKISTNENFPLYGNPARTTAPKKGGKSETVEVVNSHCQNQLNNARSRE